jgi:hypothetical protein
MILVGQLNDMNNLEKLHFVKCAGSAAVKALRGLKLVKSRPTINEGRDFFTESGQAKGNRL